MGLSVIVFFDFDGTITTKDSLADFIQYAVGKPLYRIGLLKLSPMLIAYKLKMVANDIAKEKLITYFFKDWDSTYFQTIADEYSIRQMDNIIRPKAKEKITWHINQGHKVVIVSASIEYWLKKWCEKYNIDVIATGLEKRNGKLTGKFSTKNCYGIEKVNRINERYPLAEYQCIYAYGDSAGDKEMLALAHKAYYKPFR